MQLRRSTCCAELAASGGTSYGGRCPLHERPILAFTGSLGSKVLGSLDFAG